MTSLDSRVKRVVSELLWEVFGAGDVQVDGGAGLASFVRHVGVGSAAHILNLKGVSLG